MIHRQSFSLPPVNRREILRYAGIRQETPELAALLNSALEEAFPLLSGNVCWQEFPLTERPGILDLGFAQTDSAALARNLAGCDRVVVFAATLGLGLDRLIRRYTRVSPSKALMLQAIGAERIEALCDVFCQQLCQDVLPRGLHPVPRFSPGYGDLPLDLQTDIFRVLDCPRHIGLTLNESCLMSPSKSVTALVGLASRPVSCHAAGCSACSKTDCVYRRTP